MSRRALQVVVALLALVPVSAGLFGALEGAVAFGAALPPGPDSQFRYLSGLLLAIGIAFWSTIPRIERHSARFRLLTALVLCGGVYRLLGLLRAGPVPGGMLFGLGMELLVTPALCWWQSRIAVPPSRV
ncbi:MAG: DUF4345 domain-containing protein [Gluconacetobacter diazotrophicus]|nr:DUF4345 domain-containing protein [Gluconacetobacter diazotrophicus]